jgi:hypothetical protein
MALFFDYKLQSPLADPTFLFFEWHSTFPILAIASYSSDTTGQVHIHFEEVFYFLSFYLNKKHKFDFELSRENMMMPLLFNELQLQLK